MFVGFTVGEAADVGDGDSVALAFEGVGDLAEVGLAVIFGVAEGEAVGLSCSGVGVMKITSKDGVGGTGEISPCLPFI